MPYRFKCKNCNFEYLDNKEDISFCPECKTKNQTKGKFTPEK